MNIPEFHSSIKSHVGKFLAANPGERKNSAGFVYENLELCHVAAVAWLAKNRGLVIDVHNLHEIISNYDMAQRISGFSGNVFMPQPKSDGRFNMTNLVEFFNANPNK